MIAVRILEDVRRGTIVMVEAPPNYPDAIKVEASDYREYQALQEEMESWNDHLRKLKAEAAELKAKAKLLATIELQPDEWFPKPPSMKEAFLKARPQYAMICR